MRKVKEGEDDEDLGDDGSGLWNSQPFKQPPGVPVPDCPAGSIRAQPLEVFIPSPSTIFPLVEGQLIASPHTHSLKDCRCQQAATVKHPKSAKLT